MGAEGSTGTAGSASDAVCSGRRLLAGRLRPSTPCTRGAATAITSWPVPATRCCLPSSHCRGPQWALLKSLVCGKSHALLIAEVGLYSWGMAARGVLGRGERIVTASVVSEVKGCCGSSSGGCSELESLGCCNCGRSSLHLG